MVHTFALRLLVRDLFANAQHKEKKNTKKGNTMKKGSRKRKNVMNVYLTDEEYQQIIESSSFASLSISNFARNVCLGYKVASQVDVQLRIELRKINADLGRLGGLFKLALSENKDMYEVRRLLLKIENLQTEIRKKVEQI